MVAQHNRGRLDAMLSLCIAHIRLGHGAQTVFGRRICAVNAACRREYHDDGCDQEPHGATRGHSQTPKIAGQVLASLTGSVSVRYASRLVISMITHAHLDIAGRAYVRADMAPDT